MPVLLLAHGDQESKTLLRHAIEARYGLGPPAIETLKIEFTGRSRVRVGPLATWLPLQGIAYFKFPYSVRWDYTVRPFGASVTSGIDSFNGDACHKKRGGAAVETSKDTSRVSSAQARVSALSAIFLMPLTEAAIELHAVDAATLDVQNNANDTNVRLSLNPDFTLAAVTAECFNPAINKAQRFSVRFDEGQGFVGELMLPREVVVAWDDEPQVSLVPTAAEINPPLDDAVFRLENLPAS